MISNFSIIIALSFQYSVKKTTKEKAEKSDGDIAVQHATPETHTIDSDTFTQAIIAGNTTSSSQQNEEDEYWYVANVNEEYLHNGSNAEVRRSAVEGYEYIDLEDLSENTRPQLMHNTNNIENNNEHQTHLAPSGQVEEILLPLTIQRSENPSVSTQASENRLIYPNQQTDSFSSESSSSEHYLSPVAHAAEGGSIENGYEYADVAMPVENANVQLSYIGLGPRPPHIPTVYDRLRQSQIYTDMRLDPDST